MDSALRHIGNFISTGDGAATVYLHALDAHLNAGTSQRDITHVLETINFLLSKAKTRILGLQMLDKAWPWLSQEMLEQKIELWSTFILKACNQDELQKYGGLIYKTLANLARVLKQYAELSKNFASSHLSKIYEVITLSPTAYHTSALQCAETYLSIYPKPNGQCREAMERFLSRFPDKFDDVINHCAGRCLHFLQQTSIPGSKDMKTKEQWKTYQLQLIDSLTGMLDKAYAKENGCDAVEDEVVLTIPPLKLSTEPDVRAAQLFVRFHNLCGYLRIALCEPNLTGSKPIMPKRVLNLITHGLMVTCAALNQDANYSKVAFGVFLPKIQLDLLELSKALIRVLHCHLRIYYKPLLGCLVHVLKSTAAANKALRAEVYNVLALWCQTLRDGSRCELYADELVPEILKDISPVKSELISHVKTKDKHKKAYASLNTKECVTNAFENSNQMFYVAPIKCLQEILKFCSCFLKPNTVTNVKTCVVKICASFLVTKRKDAYNNWENRLEMYRLLYTLLMAPNQYSPPPTQIILYLLRSALSNDNSAEIRFTCKEMLENIEKIVHPQKESLLIPIEARAIRNAFIKHGQETLLDKSQDSISKLRYNYEDNENIKSREEPHQNGESYTARTEAECIEVEDIEDCEEIAEISSLQREAQRTSDEMDNTNKKAAIEIDDEDIDCLQGPVAKKQKFTKNHKVQETITETVDVSDDSIMELENVGPISTIPKPASNMQKKCTVESSQERSKAANVNEQSFQKNLKASKNDGDEIAELESYFVDELRETF